MLNIVKNQDIISLMGRPKSDIELIRQIGQRIKLSMESKGLKDAAIARQIKVKPHAVWQWANGVKKPSLEHISQLSDILNVSVDFLLKGQSSLFAKDELEKDTLYIIREVFDSGGIVAAEKIPEYGRFINRGLKKPKTKDTSEGRTTRHKAGSG